MNLRYALHSALAGFKKSPVAHLAAVASLASALFVAGLVQFARTSAATALSAFGEDVEVVVYLKGSTSDAELRALEARLRDEEGAKVRAVTAQEALERLRADLGEDGLVLEHLPYNPLLPSLEVWPKESMREPAALKAMEARWSELPGVELIDVGTKAAERLQGLASALRGGGMLLLLALLLTAAVVVASTFQLAVSDRAEEVEILKLVGATDRFIRLPFLLEGALEGLLGAALASLGLWLLGESLLPSLNGFMGFVAAGTRAPALVDGATCAGLMVLGAALGLLGSRLAVLRMARL